MKDYFKFLGIALAVIVGISFLYVIMWAVKNYIDTLFFYKRVEAGTPVRLDSDNNRAGGWYVVKSRTGDTVELVLILTDKPARDLTKLKADVVCDISLLKPL